MGWFVFMFVSGLGVVKYLQAGNYRLVVITLLHCTGDIYLFLLPWLSCINRGSGLYIAVKNEPTVSKNVTEAKKWTKTVLDSK